MVSGLSVENKNRNKPIFIIISTFISLILIIFFSFYISDHSVKKYTGEVAVVETFVPESISKSAVITIKLPNEITSDEARENISFEPKIAGDWVEIEGDNLEQALLYKPKKDLEIGTYYNVSLETANLKMSGDILVAENPKIEAVFPEQNTEVDEDTKITIVFNRPMVALTTLDQQENGEGLLAQVAAAFSEPKNNLPISISPKVDGKWKWTTTRQLQFLPKDKLNPATRYTVEIGQLTSIEGLTVDPVSFTFDTRHLRLDNKTSEKISHKSPFFLHYNQEVDIDSIKSDIEITTSSGDKSEIILEYGTSKKYDKKAKKYLEVEDKSKINIYQKTDKYGHKKSWDYDTSYSVKVGLVSTLKGNLPFSDSQNYSFFVGNILSGFNIITQNGYSGDKNIFDPNDQIEVVFTEEINKDKTEFKVKGLKKVEYQQNCKTETDKDGYLREIKNGLTDECIKVDDKQRIVLSFNANEFGLNEQLQIILPKIVLSDGSEYISKADNVSGHFTTYPKFQIYNTLPKNNDKDASLTEMIICSNSPIKKPGEEGMRTHLSVVENYIVYNNWRGSYMVEGDYNQCQNGQYQTSIKYGLLPESYYLMNLNLEDVFGQKINQSLEFNTTKPKHIYKHIYNLQKQYNVTTPDKTKLTFAVENLTFVDLQICKMNATDFLEVLGSLSIKQPAPNKCTEIKTARIDLPKTYFVNNYFQIDLKDYFADTRGQFVITLNNPDYTYVSDYYAEDFEVPRFEHVYLSVSNLAVGKKEVNRDHYEEKIKPQDNLIENSKNIYWVNNAKTLLPIAGAIVSQYKHVNGIWDQTAFGDGLTLSDTNFTDQDGIAKLKIENYVDGAVISYNNENAIISDWADTLGSNWTTAEYALKTYLYTDRPIYRPGDVVYFKGIQRLGFDGNYEILKDQEIQVSIRDSGWDQVFATTLKNNKYGSFAGEFTLPKDAKLGSYQINTASDGYFNFSVEEYTPAAFKLEAVTDKEEYLSGDTLNLSLQADYYFGVPLDSGNVSYTITEQDYYFDKYTDEYFSFGSGWYYCYNCDYGDKYLLRGETSLNTDGQAIIKQELKLSDNDEKSKIITVSVSVQDASGKTISIQKSFIVHRGEYYIGAKTDKYYTNVDGENKLRIKTVDTFGKPISVSNLIAKIKKISYEIYKRQEVDGGYYYHYDKSTTEVKTIKLGTDKNGNYINDFSIAEEGEYEIEIVGSDNRKNNISTTISLYIYGDKTVQVPPNNNYSLDLVVEKNELKVGDMATILIKSPAAKAKALITIERGVIFDYKIIDVIGGLAEYSFLIKENYAPNIFVSVLLLTDEPEIKFGNVDFGVNSDAKKIFLSVKSDKTFYLPGENVNLQIESKDEKNNPVQSEVSVAVVDMSVLALKGNPKKNPWLHFYNYFYNTINTTHNLKNILYEMDIPTGTKGGGGGNGAEDLASKKRGEFKDTAFWIAQAETDQKGLTQLSFTLPDNLTTWQAEVVAQSLDSKFGASYAEFTTKKDLMVSPIKPRFIVPGDNFELGATVFNQTNKSVSVKVSLQSKDLNLLEKTERIIKINAGKSEIIYFNVEAPTTLVEGQVTFTLKAELNDSVDEVEQTIKITPNQTYETVSTANMTNQNISKEYFYIPENVLADKGGITINTNATLVVFLQDALKYMVNYPYGCSEQLTSAMSSVAILSSVYDLKNVDGEIGTINKDGIDYTIDDIINSTLKKIYATQKLDGGFSYYPSIYYSNFYLTLRVVEGLLVIKNAGFAIDEEYLNKALKYIETEANNRYTQREIDKDTLIGAGFLLNLSGKKYTVINSIVSSFISDKQYLNENISSPALAYLAIMYPNNQEIYKQFTNRLSIDGRGAYFKPGKNTSYNLYETSIKNTALALKVFVAHQDKNVMISNIMKWLLASRNNQGAWGNTQNTFEVIDAMVQYLKWQKENEADFDLIGTLNGDELFNFNFGGQNIFETQSQFLSINDLERKKVLPLTFLKIDNTKNKNNFYYDILFKYYLPVQNLPARDEGLGVVREFFRLDDEEQKIPILSAKVGDVIKGRLTLTVPFNAADIAIEDYIPAGFEIVNFSFATEDQSLIRHTSLDNRFYPSVEENHDDRIFLYSERVNSGVYQYEYYLRALVPGKYQHLPAKIESLYMPDIFGRSRGNTFVVEK